MKVRLLYVLAVLFGVFCLVLGSLEFVGVIHCSIFYSCFNVALGCIIIFLSGLALVQEALSKSKKS
jgi:uncharacterized membrane protein YedE/YeeE